MKGIRVYIQQAESSSTCPALLTDPHICVHTWVHAYMNERIPALSVMGPISRETNHEVPQLMGYVYAYSRVTSLRKAHTHTVNVCMYNNSDISTGMLSE